jgi:hypothetical protein
MLSHPSSSDLTPSDFFLFRYLKNTDERIDLLTDKVLINASMRILLVLMKETLDMVYAEWQVIIPKFIELSAERFE